MSRSNKRLALITLRIGVEAIGGTVVQKMGLRVSSLRSEHADPTFTVANSVVNGIHAMPNQFTGGEGAVTGEEVQFMITFTVPFLVGATDHDFFRPEAGLSSGNFLWLSVPKPIGSPGTPFQFPGRPTTDLQSWIRNDRAGDLARDCVGTGSSRQVGQ